MTAYVVLIAAVALERLAELVIARRNLVWAKSRGGVVSGFGHYPFMVVLHTGLLLACLVEAVQRPFVPALGWPCWCWLSWPRRSAGGASAPSAPGGTPAS